MGLGSLKGSNADKLWAYKVYVGSVAVSRVFGFEAS